MDDLHRLQAAWTRAPWHERGPLCAPQFAFRACTSEGGSPLTQADAAAREAAMDRGSPADFRVRVADERVDFLASGWLVRRRLVVTGGDRSVTVDVCHVCEVRDGNVTVLEEYYDPSELRAAFPGRYMPHL